MEAATIEASNLLVKRTATHVYFFGYDGPDPEVCIQQWFQALSLIVLWMGLPISQLASII
jgi:hypothetical protein